MIRRHPFIFLLVCIVALAMACLLTGPVSISPSKVFAILFGIDNNDDTAGYIVLESRLPQMLTALFSGSALAVSGLMLQTAFRNPLAGPSIFGISSGASLGVALVMLMFGGTLTAGSLTLSGYVAILAGAAVGALVVTVIIVVMEAADVVLGIEHTVVLIEDFGGNVLVQNEVEVFIIVA